MPRRASPSRLSSRATPSGRSPMMLEAMLKLRAQWDVFCAILTPNLLAYFHNSCVFGAGSRSLPETLAFSSPAYGRAAERLRPLTGLLTTADRRDEPVLVSASTAETGLPDGDAVRLAPPPGTEGANPSHQALQPAGSDRPETGQPRTGLECSPARGKRRCERGTRRGSRGECRPSGPSRRTPPDRGGGTCSTARDETAQHVPGQGMSRRHRGKPANLALNPPIFKPTAEPGLGRLRRTTPSPLQIRCPADLPALRRRRFHVLKCAVGQPAQPTMASISYDSLPITSRTSAIT